MAQENTHTDHRKMVHEWETPEFIPLPRSKRWYIGASIIFALVILYGIFTRSITMVLVFVMVAVVFFITSKHQPAIVKAQITDMGIFYKEKFYPYHHINAFWIVYHPPYVASLYLKIRKGKRLEDLKIELFHENPANIRALLINEVPEIEGAGEPMTDLLTRLLRLQ